MVSKTLGFGRKSFPNFSGSRHVYLVPHSYSQCNVSMLFTHPKPPCPRSLRWVSQYNTRKKARSAPPAQTSGFVNDPSPMRKWNFKRSCYFHAWLDTHLHHTLPETNIGPAKMMVWRLSLWGQKAYFDWRHLGFRELVIRENHEISCEKTQLGPRPRRNCELPGTGENCLGPTFNALQAESATAYVWSYPPTNSG